MDCTVDHAFDTGAHSPVNKNAYVLFVQQLQEQVRQIEDLLKYGLIRESVSHGEPPYCLCPRKQVKENVHRLQNAKKLQDPEECLTPSYNSRMY
jgi:hypothetical protein